MGGLCHILSVVPVLGASRGNLQAKKGLRVSLQEGIGGEA